MFLICKRFYMKKNEKLLDVYFLFLIYVFNLTNQLILHILFLELKRINEIIFKI